MNRLAWGVVAVLVFFAVMSAPTVAADDFERYVEDPIIEPGEEQTVTVEVEYSPDEGDGLDNVSSVTADLSFDDDDIDVLTNEQHIASSMTDGSTRIVSFDIAVAETVDGDVIGDLQINHDDITEPAELPVTFEVQDQARFDGTVLDSTLQPDTTRDVAVELENIGQEAADEAVVRFATTDADVQLFPGDPYDVDLVDDGSTPGSAAEVYVGDWPENENKMIDVPVYVADDTPPQNVTIRAVVEFEDSLGIDRESDELVFGAEVLEEQRFSLSVDYDNSDIRVGEEGTVGVNLTNNGEENVTDVMLRPATEDIDDFPMFNGDEGISLTEDHVYLPELSTGETAETTVQVSVSGEVEPGWQVLPMEIRYRGAADDIRTSDVLDMPVEINPERDEFGVDIETAAVDQGETDRIELTVINQLDETITDVQAQLYTDDPLASDDDQAFVQELAPDETTTLTFEIEATEDAGEKTYPARIDFQYEDGGGDVQLSDVYRIPVDVEDPGTNWIRLGLLLGGLLVVGAGAAIRYADYLRGYLPRVSVEFSDQSDSDSTTEE